MSGRIPMLRNALFGAAVAASLAFGVRTAAAGPVVSARQACADPSAEGSCASQSDCRKICNRLSNGLIAFCDLGTGCCDCQKL
ncbi:MAG TPA: hypothetical protein VFR81_25645 [Longimicrobium sp.]|nr:hypothetical protein [Longimicrobium sp.]